MERIGPSSGGDDQYPAVDVGGVTPTGVCQVGGYVSQESNLSHLDAKTAREVSFARNLLGRSGSRMSGGSHFSGLAHNVQERLVSLLELRQVAAEFVCGSPASTSPADTSTFDLTGFEGRLAARERTQEEARQALQNREDGRRTGMCMTPTGQMPVRVHLSALSDQVCEMVRPEGAGFFANRGRSGTSLVPSKTAFIQANAKDEQARTCRSIVRDVLRSRYTETMIALNIFLHFAMTVVETDAEAGGAPPAPWVQDVLIACFAFVVMEYVLRIYGFGILSAMEDPWNWLDTFIIISGFFEYIVRFSSLRLEEISGVGMLRLCRLIRLMRICRHLKYSRELMKLVQMMGSCFRTLFWSFLLMGFVMTMWAIIAVEVVHPYAQELARDGHWEGCEGCKDAFSSVFRADLTLFQTIVAGDSWGEIAIPIIQYKPWTSVVFIGSLLTLVFGVLNLVLAVVVDTSADLRAKDVMSRGHEMEFEEFEEKSALLRMMDRVAPDHGGLISFRELKDCAHDNAEFSHWLRVLDIDATDLKQLFQMVDKEQQGAINPQDFIETLWRTKHTESKTATGFVKDLVRKIHRQQNQLDKKLESKLQKMERQLLTVCAALLSKPSKSEKNHERRESRRQKSLDREEVSSESAHEPGGVSDCQVSQSMTQSMSLEGVYGADSMLSARLEGHLESIERVFQTAMSDAIDKITRGTASEAVKQYMEAMQSSSAAQEGDDGDSMEGPIDRDFSEIPSDSSRAESCHESCVDVGSREDLHGSPRDRRSRHPLAGIRGPKPPTPVSARQRGRSPLSAVTPGSTSEEQPVRCLSNSSGEEDCVRVSDDDLAGGHVVFGRRSRVMGPRGAPTSKPRGPKH